MKSIRSAGWPAPAAPEPRAQRGAEPSPFDLALEAAERRRRDDAPPAAARHDRRDELARAAAEPERRDDAVREPREKPARAATEPKPRRDAARAAAEPRLRGGEARAAAAPRPRASKAHGAAEPTRHDKVPRDAAAPEGAAEASGEEQDESEAPVSREDETGSASRLAALGLLNPPQLAEASAPTPASTAALASAAAPTAGALAGDAAGASNAVVSGSAGATRALRGAAVGASGAAVEAPAAPSNGGALAASPRGPRGAASTLASPPPPVVRASVPTAAATGAAAEALPAAATGAGVEAPSAAATGVAGEAAARPATGVAGEAAARPAASVASAASSAATSAALAGAVIIGTLGPAEGDPGVAAAASATAALPPGTRVGRVDVVNARQGRGRAAGVEASHEVASLAGSDLGARRIGDLPHQIVSVEEKVSTPTASSGASKQAIFQASAASEAARAPAFVAEAASVSGGAAARAGKGAPSVEGEAPAPFAAAEGAPLADQAAAEVASSLGAAPAEAPLALALGGAARAGQASGAMGPARASAESNEAVPARLDAGEDERHRLVAAGVNRLALRHGLRAEADVPELGRVSVEARSAADGSIDLRVSAADPAAAIALGRHQGELVQALEASSVPVGRVSIDASAQGAPSLWQGSPSPAQSHAQGQGQFQGGGKSGREGTQARPAAERNDDRSAHRPGRSRVRVVLLGEHTVSVSSLRTTSDNGLLSGTAGSSSSGSSAGAAAPAMDKDAFLKLLVAQISHQDPLKPMEGTEFVTQLAQFSAVEQAMQQSQRLELLSAQMSGLANNAATDLVGKTVTLRGKSVAFDGVTATGASVTLGGAAESVKVTVRDASGKAVRTLDLGAKPAGALAVTWDGKDDAGQPVSAGSYSLEVQAKNADGAAVAVSQDVQGVVKGVYFDKGYPEILLDSGVRAPISDLIGVVGQAAPLSP